MAQKVVTEAIWITEPKIFVMNTLQRNFPSTGINAQSWSTSTHCYLERLSGRGTA
jgi:hypothetical protein